MGAPKLLSGVLAAMAGAAVGSRLMVVTHSGSNRSNNTYGLNLSAVAVKQASNWIVSPFDIALRTIGCMILVQQ